MQREWEEQARPSAEGSPRKRFDMEEFISRYVALAEEDPKDPVTCEALLWLSNRFRKFKGIAKAEELARREFPLAGEYIDLKREYDEAEESYFEASRKATTDEARRKAYEDNYPKPEKFTGRFLALARKDPASPAGKEALTWIIQRARQGSDFEAALELASQHHVRSPGIGVVCQALVYSQAAGAERFLRGVADQNPHAEAKGNAQMALARYLARKAEAVRFLRQSSLEQLAQAETYYGKRGLEKLRTSDPASLSQEAEKLFEQVAEGHGDVKTFTGNLAEQAKAELFEIRNLAIGKTAPDIVGQDVDGKTFKLSDYRGKVVVIDFWGDW